MRWIQNTKSFLLQKVVCAGGPGGQVPVVFAVDHPVRSASVHPVPPRFSVPALHHAWLMRLLPDLLVDDPVVNHHSVLLSRPLPDVSVDSQL